jgi:hypothetical protein
VGGYLGGFEEAKWCDLIVVRAYGNKYYHVNICVA